MLVATATGVLTALASYATASAAEAEETETGVDNVVVADLGITSVRGNKVVEAAYNELNSNHRWETPMGSNCNYYSSAFNKPCQAWCADFTKYVWKNAGVYDWQRLDSEAGTTARWAYHYAHWHWGTAGIIPGAAVTYNASGDPFVDSDHVGTFVGWVNGSAKVISGNFNDQVYKHNLHYSSSRPIAGWAEVF
jgi:hypothetical protein